VRIHKDLPKHVVDAILPQSIPLL